MSDILLQDQVQQSVNNQSDRSTDELKMFWRLRWFLVYLYATALILSIAAAVIITIVTRNVISSVLLTPLLLAMKPIVKWAFVCINRGEQMARAHNPGPKPKYGGRIEKCVRISYEVAVLIDKESAILSVNQGKPLGISDVVERVFRQHYGLPPEREQTMLISNLEQIIDQFPSREFSYTYSTIFAASSIVATQ